MLNVRACSSRGELLDHTMSPESGDDHTVVGPISKATDPPSDWADQLDFPQVKSHMNSRAGDGIVWPIEETFEASMVGWYKENLGPGSDAWSKRMPAALRTIALALNTGLIRLKPGKSVEGLSTYSEQDCGDDKTLVGKVYVDGGLEVSSSPTDQGMEDRPPGRPGTQTGGISGTTASQKQISAWLLGLRERP